MCVQTVFNVCSVYDQSETIDCGDTLQRFLSSGGECNLTSSEAPCVSKGLYGC